MMRPRPPANFPPSSPTPGGERACAATAQALRGVAGQGLAQLRAPGAKIRV